MRAHEYTSDSGGLLRMGHKLDTADLVRLNTLQAFRDTAQPSWQHLDPVGLSCTKHTGQHVSPYV